MKIKVKSKRRTPRRAKGARPQTLNFPVGSPEANAAAKLFAAMDEGNPRTMQLAYECLAEVLAARYGVEAVRTALTAAMLRVEDLSRDNAALKARGKTSAAFMAAAMMVAARPPAAPSPRLTI